jgi:hypothetical protein
VAVGFGVEAATTRPRAGATAEVSDFSVHALSSTRLTEMRPDTGPIAVRCSVAPVTDVPAGTVNFRYDTLLSVFSLPATSLSSAPKLPVLRPLDVYVSSLAASLSSAPVAAEAGLAATNADPVPATSVARTDTDLCNFERRNFLLPRCVRHRCGRAYDRDSGAAGARFVPAKVLTGCGVPAFARGAANGGIGCRVSLMLA